MSKFEPVIDDLRDSLSKLIDLWAQFASRRVRVVRHPPKALGSDDVTDEFANAFRMATDALLKAVTILEGVRGKDEG